MNQTPEQKLLEQWQRRYDYFYHTEPLEDLSESLQDTCFDYIYDRYDKLMEAFPKRIERHCIGYGYNIEGEIDTSYPIYEYVIQPLETTNVLQDGEDTSLMPSPEFLFTSGVHGTEKTATYALYQMMKQMLYNPYGHQRVARLASRHTFRVVPIVNPGGCNIPNRFNPRGIDLNRNFSEINGTKIQTEVEAQVISQWLHTHRDAFAYVDFHNFIRNFYDRQPVMCSYHFSPNSAMNEAYSAMIRQISPDWSERYLQSYPDAIDIAYGFILGKQYNDTPTTVNEAYHQHGIQLASTIESSNQDPDDLDRFNTKKALELAVDIYMNYILEIAEQFSPVF